MAKNIYVGNLSFETTASDLEALFGQHTFGLAEMRARLPKQVYKALCRTMDHGEPLDPSVAGRMKAFQDGVEKLLYLKPRPGTIKRTTTPSGLGFRLQALEEEGTPAAAVVGKIVKGKTGQITVKRRP